MFTDNKNFYPTPNEVIETMILAVDNLSTMKINAELFSSYSKFNGTMLEPSAGKGNIADYILAKYCNKNSVIDVMEIDSHLQAILLNKQHKLIHDDFLSYNYVTNYDVMMINPPFDNGEKHLLKAISLASKQIKPCFVSCLLNTETLDNPYTSTRKELVNIIETAVQMSNGTVKELGNVFSSSERNTDVNVTLVTLYIEPEYMNTAVNLNEEFWANTAKSNEPTSTDIVIRDEMQEVGFKEDEILSAIATYHDVKNKIMAVYQAQKIANTAFNYCESNVNLLGIEKEKSYIFSQLNYSYPERELEEKLNRIKHEFWNIILKSNTFRKLLTESAMQDLQNTIGNISSMEITEFSVNYLLTALGQNYANMMNLSVVNFFDKVTRYSYAEYSNNIYLYNGWKTNKPHAINKKIILPAVNTYMSSYPLSSWVTKDNSIDYLLRNFLSDMDKMAEIISPNKATGYETIGKATFENNFFLVKLYKKGTIHITFKDNDVLTKLNYLGAKNKNWLPTDEEMKTNSAKDYVARLLKGDLPLAIK